MVNLWICPFDCAESLMLHLLQGNCHATRTMFSMSKHSSVLSWAEEHDEGAEFSGETHIKLQNHRMQSRHLNRLRTEG
jgi:hypothetical protein